MNTLEDRSINEFGLENYHLDFIVQAVGNYAGVDEARIFGSRALGNYKRTSDIDIALMGNLKDFTVGSLRHFLNNAAPFLYKVDVLDYGKLNNAELKKHIDEYGKVIFKRAG
ncbi:MAG: nucleotidyltransferase domain-containing protein [Patescibacteria group bacterium]|nr:nucleotidyltransferase domain-containing protein [Patescibacteria group bacterium]